VKEYYDRRAPEYDATSHELVRSDQATASDAIELEAAIASLPPGRILDVACGTGWLTRLLRGRVVGLDQSEAMLRLARGRLPDAVFVRAEVPPLPFPSDSIDLVFSSHFYGHLDRETGHELIAEARRVASAVVIVEEAWRPGLPDQPTVERRTLGDGSTHDVYKRYFTASGLAAELGGAVLLDTPSLVAVRTDFAVT
jgi:demethylmenaquinone methyltransferase/2-methoxy-6-polyprenyl-1,4-benzoquinol methylase